MSAPLAGLEEEISGIVHRFMREFEIPGVAVALVLPGGQTLARGHGVARLGEPAPVDADTVFAMASNSKAFLCACLAMLVDEGRLAWNDPVLKHLPEFRMFDPAATAMMTVRDLLVHRSGLPLGAGDLMQFPRTDHTAAEVLAALRHFKPATGFRSGYAYDNCLYLVAGLLLQRVSGLGWDEFVQSRIFAPLGMAGAVSNPTLMNTAHGAGRHARLGPPTIGMGPLERIEPDEPAIIGPAGGICASAADVLPWLRVQLARGAISSDNSGGTRLWTAARADEMWTPHTIVSSGPGPTPDAPQRSVMQGYALGWAVSDYRGRRMLTHGGGLAGQSSRTTLLPEQGIGLALFSNSGDAEPISCLRYALLDRLLDRSLEQRLGTPGFDWVAAARKTVDQLEQQVAQVLGQGDFQPPPGAPTLGLDCYAGRYRDPWYGDLLVTHQAGGLAVDFTRTRLFKSALEPFGADSFRTRFPRGAGEDAVLTFAVENGAVTGITLRALSPIADFSFNFHDLAFVPLVPVHDASAPPA